MNMMKFKNLKGEILALQQKVEAIRQLTHLNAEDALDGLLFDEWLITVYESSVYSDGTKSLNKFEISWNETDLPLKYFEERFSDEIAAHTKKMKQKQKEREELEYENFLKLKSKYENNLH